MRSLAGAYIQAVQERLGRSSTEVEQRPALMAQAWTDVLSVAGAGISLVSEVRIPLGASDDSAAHAEQLQVTFGEGPCLLSMHTQEPLTFDHDEMTRRWPLLTQDLTDNTPYQSVASIPIGAAGGPPLAALDLYSNHSAPDRELSDAATTATIEALTSAYLFATPLPSPSDSRPSSPELSPWLTAAHDHPRMQVWQVVGQMLAHTPRLTPPDALALIRAYAYSHHINLDEIIHLVISGKLDPAAVADG